MCQLGPRVVSPRTRRMALVVVKMRWTHCSLHGGFATLAVRPNGSKWYDFYALLMAHQREMQQNGSGFVQ